MADREAFAADMAAGMNTNALARKHNLTWDKANRLRRAIVMGVEPDGEPAEPAEAVEETGPQPEPDGELVYTLSIEVPVDAVDDLIRRIPAQELVAAVLAGMEPDAKAQLIEAVMQRRMKLVTEAQAVDLGNMDFVIEARSHSNGVAN